MLNMSAFDYNLIFKIPKVLRSDPPAPLLFLRQNIINFLGETEIANLLAFPPVFTSKPES